MYDSGATRSDNGEQAIQTIANKIAMTMCTYGQIDTESLSKAIIDTGVKKEISKEIIIEISTVEYKDKINFIIILMSKVGDLKNICIEKKRNRLIRKILSNSKVGKHDIIKEIKDLIYSISIGYQLRSSYSKQLVIFFLHYLILFIRNRIC